MIEDSTKKFYELTAAKYAEETLPIRLDDLWNTFSTRLFPHASVLDLGCGGGRDLKELARRGLSVVGVEYSVPLAELARQYSRQEVWVGDMRVFDLGVGKFDGIWAVASLLHVPRNEIVGVLRKLYEALRSNGILLTSMKKGKGNETAPDGRYFEFYHPEEWELMLKTVGFDIEGQQVSTEKRQTVSGDARQIAWFVTIARNSP
ncbi:MAG TPA: class I SAM-dependent methyltransferase [Pyrinomonadaceae bacterium]|nr:class I SAM-dependent methyltransferase [Pyrinomonadaceae bacterium]